MPQILDGCIIESSAISGACDITVSGTAPSSPAVNEPWLEV